MRDNRSAWLTASSRAQVLRKYGLLSEDEVDAMEALGEAVGLAKLNAAQEEDLLGDVPDEYMDPLLGIVMQVGRSLNKQLSRCDSWRLLSGKQPHQ